MPGSPSAPFAVANCAGHSGCPSSAWIRPGMTRTIPSRPDSTDSPKLPDTNSGYHRARPPRARAHGTLLHKRVPKPHGLRTWRDPRRRRIAGQDSYRHHWTSVTPCAILIESERHASHAELDTPGADRMNQGGTLRNSK